MTEEPIITAKTIYGVARVRHETLACISFPKPAHGLEAAWWAVRRGVHEFVGIVVPSMLFAISVTCFMWAFGMLR